MIPRKYIDFINEVFEAAKKHKVNLNLKIDSSSESEFATVEADITGAWPIRSDCDAVEVHGTPHSQSLFNIMGDRDDHRKG
jgi:hypothetical protein